VVRLGVVLPVREVDGGPLGPATLADGARRIEDAGFASAWVFDALGRGFLLPDPLTALAIAATVTTGIELGTGVLQLPLRPPFELAQRVATTQLVAGGRLLLGVGAGSTVADFTAVGADHAARFATFSRHLDALVGLLAGDEVDGSRLSPWPAVVGGPPILVGSWAGSLWIPRAARRFDGWIGSGARSSWTLVAQGAARYRDAGGTGRVVITNVAADLDAVASPDGGDDPVELVGPPAVVGERLARLDALGVHDVVVVTRAHGAGDLARLRATWPA
jgi:alkanesulfonate monooxygenase SsuD/methylene tetrahydromethanopterin reductase-like flavin-dependent oxidoreductase (luciferase family)